jgi:molecular chaperone GrpE
MTPQPDRRRPAGAPEEERRPAGVPEPSASQQGGHHPPAAQPGKPGSSVGADAPPSRGASHDLRDRAPSGASTRAEADSEEAGGVDARQVERDFDELLEETKRERDEYLELAQRTKADFENYRKRVAGETEAARRRGKAELASELVPVLDNLERALIAADIDLEGALAGEVSEEGALEHGVVLTYRDLHETLARAGVEAYDPAGEKFDPEWHEALSTRPGEGTDPGTVLDVVQKGYRLDGQVIRAARVVVSE